MLKFQCPHCQQEIETEDENAGQEAICPNCSKTIVVPALETSNQSEENKPADSSSPESSGHWKLKKNNQENPSVQIESGNIPVATPIPVPPVTPFSISKPSNLSMATTALILGILSFIGVPLCGLGALILGIIALSKISRSDGMLLGKGKAIAGIVFGCWSIVRIVLAFAVLMPMAAKARDRAREVSCISNIKKICNAYSFYYFDYCYLPSSIDDIQQFIGLNKLLCPAIGVSKPYFPHDNYGGYVLLSVENYATPHPQRRLSDFCKRSEVPIVMCTRHKNVDIIGYMDGHVEAKPKQGITQP